MSAVLLLIGCLDRTPNTYHSAGVRSGTATSTSTLSGTTSGSITAGDVLSAPMVSSPLTTADCCLVTDGGGAVVVTSLERARDLRSDPVVVLGYGECTTNTSMTSAGDILDTGAARSAQAAFGRAGIGPSDVDVADLYDSFTITVLLSLEALGFCPPRLGR
jgi:acetyl-CoA acetyltransferase